MPDYLMLIESNETAEAALPPSELKALVEGYSGFERTLRVADAFVDGERLRPSGEGRRVRVRGAAAQVETGPFGEHALVAYYLLRAQSLDAAIALAQQFPATPGVILEVRPVMKGRLEPGKSSQRGRVFAFAVLGNAPNERGWQELMDRIDERTQDHFPADRQLGGLRLEAPGQGRQVKVSQGRRAVFDGPFLESKEVIGGVFFLRMESLEEAVRWASQTEFVKLGSVEIRELWRS